MNLLELLIKGAGHKYIKRIPVGTTKTGKVRYRYIYRADHTVGGKHLLDEAHLKAGTKLLLHSKDGAEVHAHIDSVKGDQVTFTYDDGDRKGETRTVSKQKLLAEFNKENKVEDKITSAKAALLADIKAAADRGTSKKQLARLVARLERLDFLFRGEAESEQDISNDNQRKLKELRSERDNIPSTVGDKEVTKTEQERADLQEFNRLTMIAPKDRTEQQEKRRKDLKETVYLPLRARAEQETSRNRNRIASISREIRRLEDSIDMENDSLLTFGKLALKEKRKAGEAEHTYKRREGERLIKLSEARLAKLDENRTDNVFGVTSRRVDVNIMTAQANKEAQEGRRLIAQADREDPAAGERKRKADILSGIEYTQAGESDTTKAGARTAKAKKRDNVLLDYLRIHIASLEPGLTRSALTSARADYQAATNDKTRAKRDAARAKIKRIIS